MKGLLIFLIDRGIAMDRKKVHAFSLFLLLLLVILTASSCSDVRSAYDKGNYRQVVTRISRMKNPSQSDLILKAKSYFALGEGNKALEALLLYLFSDESTQTPEDRSYAVGAFLSLVPSDSLVIMVLKPEDGYEAQKALYGAYSRTDDTASARNVLAYLSEHLDFPSYVNLMFSAPSDPDFMLEVIENGKPIEVHVHLHHHDHDDDDHDEHEHHHDHDHDEHDHDEHEHHHDHDHDEHDHDEHEHHHDHDHHHHHHAPGEHDADEVFQNIGVETARRFEQDELRGMVNQLSDEEEYGRILRAKGILQNAAGEWFQFDYVPGELEIRPSSADYTGRLCVIGADINEKALRELFNV